jgi:RNA polymerase sigma-70 factor (ECF subfamily)
MEDAAIIGLYWARDQRAIAETDEKYGPFCRRMALNILTVREDAEECVNDAYHQAWNTMPPQRPDSLRAYLGRIVRNLSLDLWRRNHAQKRDRGMEQLLGELEDCVPARQSVEQDVEAAELTRLLARWLEGLPPRDRALFLRRYWNGEPVTAIAAAAGEPANRVSQRLARLRKRLRNTLEREGITL